MQKESLHCPGTPQCSGHGTCLASGACQCNDPWTGPECNKGIVSILLHFSFLSFLHFSTENVPIETNVTNGGIVVSPNVGSQTMFTIVLQQIQEVDAADKEVYSIHNLGTNFTLKVIALIIDDKPKSLLIPNL